MQTIARVLAGTFPRGSEFPHGQTLDTMCIVYLVTVRQLSNSYVLVFTKERIETSLYLAVIARTYAIGASSILLRN